MALPANIDYGTVTGLFNRVGADGADEDLRPDSDPLFEVPITFTPDLRAPALVTTRGSDTEPAQTILVDQVVCYTDGNGRLVGRDGVPGVRLIAGGDPDLIPNGWTWRVSYGAPIPNSFSFVLMPGQLVDLADVIKVPANIGAEVREWQKAMTEAQGYLADVKRLRDEIIAAGGTGGIGGTGGVPWVAVVTGNEPRPLAPVVVWFGGIIEPTKKQTGDIWLSEGTPAPAADVDAPTAPTGVTVTGIIGNGFTVTWNASTDNKAVTGYEVLANDQVVATTTAATFVAVTGLAPSVTYAVRVRARDAAGNRSLPSTAVNATTTAAGDTQAPTTPTNLVSSAISSSGFTVSWTASGDNVGVSAYEVQVNGAAVATPTSPTVSLTGYAAASTYAVRVRARDAAGNWSALSTPLNVTTTGVGDTVAPTVPTGVAASGITSGSATISWTPATDAVGVTGYDVQFNGVSKGTPSAATLAVTGLVPETQYQVRVRARDAAGNWSGLSTAITFTTTAAVVISGHSVFAATPALTFSRYNDGGTLQVATGFYTYQSDTVGWKVKGMRIYLPAGAAFPAPVNCHLYMPTLGQKPDLSSPIQTVQLATMVPGQWNSVEFATPMTMTPGTPVWVGYQSSDGTYIHTPRPTGDPFITAADGSHVALMDDDAVYGGNRITRSFYRVNGGSTTASSASAPVYGVDIIVGEA